MASFTSLELTLFLLYQLCCHHGSGSAQVTSLPVVLTQKQQDTEGCFEKKKLKSYRRANSAKGNPCCQKEEIALKLYLRFIF